MNREHSFFGSILAIPDVSLLAPVLNMGQPRNGLRKKRERKQLKFLPVALWLGVLLLALLTTHVETALALQVHGPPEGLYVHQMAHLHYFFALVFFLWYIRRAAFTSRGWRFLQLFCLLMGLWNILAFVGHIAASNVEPEALLQGSHYLSLRLLPPYSINNLVYYLAKLDHLLCMPALFCLYMAIRTFYRSAVTEMGEKP